MGELKFAEYVKCLMNLARPERFELPTSWFVATHSIQLSYGRVLVPLKNKFSMQFHTL